MDLVQKIIIKATDKASAAMQRVRANSTGLAGALDKANKELKKLEGAEKKLAAYPGLKKKLAETKQAFRDNQRQQQALREEMRKSGTATRTQEQELSRLQMQGHRLRDSFIRQVGSIRENAAALRKSGVDTRNLADGQQLLKNRMEQVSATAVRQKAALERLAAAEGRMKSAGAMAGTIGLKAAGYGLFARQVGRGLSHPVKAAMDEEDAMLGIVKQVQGLKNADNSLNHAEIAKVRTEIQGLSRELPVATTEIMAMYEAGARMDVPRQELAGYVKTAAIAATAFDAEDMGALAENLGRINKNFKLSAEQGRELADVINYLDDNSLSKGAELIEYMNRVSGSMGLAKISDKNTAALGSTLLSSGVDESTAANAVSSLFTRLSTAPDMKPVREALKGLGMDAKAVQKGMVTDANATVMKIIEAVKKMPKEKQAGFLKGLAGGEYNKVFATLVSNTEEWRRQLELANSEAAKGSMAREFETRAGAMSSKWQEFKNQLFNTGAELGMTLMPAINELLDKGSRWLSVIGAWVKENPQLAQGLMKAAAVVGMLAAAFAAIGFAVSGVLMPMAAMRWAWVKLTLDLGGGTKSIGLFARMFGGLGGILRTGIGWLTGLGRAFLWVGRLFLTNPILLAIAAVVGGLYLLWKHWDTVKAALVAGWQWIDRTFSENPILNFVFLPIGMMRLLVNNWNTVVGVLKTGWEWLKNTLADNPLVRAFREPGGILDRLRESWEQFKSGLIRGWEWLKSILRDNPLLAAFAGPLGILASLIANIDRLIAKAGALKEAFKNLNIGERINAPFRSIGRVFDGKGFSGGGYTGAGGVNEIAGAVHRGEVVFSQADVRRWGGWRVVDALRTGRIGAGLLGRVKGALSGRPAAGTARRPAPAAMPAFQTAAAAPSFGGITININAGGQSVESIAQAVRRELEKWQAAAARRTRSSMKDRD